MWYNTNNLKYMYNNVIDKKFNKKSKEIKIQPFNKKSKEIKIQPFKVSIDYIKEKQLVSMNKIWNILT